MSNLPYEERMLNLTKVIRLLDQAIEEKKPLSLARFSHTEISLAWNSWPNWIETWTLREYNGSTGDPYQMQQEVREALLTVDIAGLLSRHHESDRSYAEATKELLEYLKFQPKFVCSAWITHDMSRSSEFWTWLKRYKVFIVGRRAAEAVPEFTKRGVVVTGTTTLEGYQEIEGVLEKVCLNPTWEVAILSAGLPATLLAPRLAVKSSRVVLDFGHAIDIILEGHQWDHDKVARRWVNKQKGTNQ